MNATYRLRCSSCDLSFDDDGSTLACPNRCDGLLVSDYAERRFRPDATYAGTYRYHRWLPVRRHFAHTGAVGVFRAAAWGKRVGLPNLWFAFSGWWPERGATLPSATFKELEAFAVLGRLSRDDDRTLVIASAGNTAAAFARTCSLYGRHCTIVVPKSALAKLRFSEPLESCVTFVAVDGEYDDAIVLARALAARPGFVAEGGVRNVARRDGMGVAMLAAAEAIGRIPDAYVQAVGSGAGALAAYEASLRLIGDGRFGTRPPRLMLAQNAPFTPLVDSWCAGSKTFLPVEPALARERIAAIGAKVLSNQHPPYAPPGGVYAALHASAGAAFRVGNADAAEAALAFEAAEGIDIDPAAAVALASLPQVAATLADRSATVLLHLTGGGWRSRRAADAIYGAEAALLVDRDAIAAQPTLDLVAALVRRAPATLAG